MHTLCCDGDEILYLQYLSVSLTAEGSTVSQRRQWTIIEMAKLKRQCQSNISIEFQ